MQLAFDECHRAKRFGPKATSSVCGRLVVDLQNDLKNARVVYSSATGASQPSHLGYMTRLHLWGEGTCFFDSEAFINEMDKRFCNNTF